MRLFGLEISRAPARAAQSVSPQYVAGHVISNGTRAAQTAVSPVSENRGGWFRIFESRAGAWQDGVVVDRQMTLSYHAVYACMTLIASDIAKLRIKLVEDDGEGVWSETRNSAYSPVLRKPNHFQNRIQFVENWVLSKLTRGNTYVLKERDNRGVVRKLYVLDPNRVLPLVSESGEVFYQLSADNIAGLEQDVIVPAREIIHDRINCLFHPLVGTSPIFAAGVAAMQGLRIQNNSERFFRNQSQPGGILMAAGAISDETATRLKEYWETNFTGDKAGRVAVVGDGLKYEPLAISAQDSQLIEQLKWTAEVICSVFHVPPYKIGVGALPSYNNVQALNVEYYSQGLQRHLEDIELCLDEGLDVGEKLGTEFDLAGLLRMDSVTQMSVLKEGVTAGVLAPNEARQKIDLPKVEGGETPYLQQQNYSLKALAKRDASDDPFANGNGGAKPPPAANDNLAEEAAKALLEIQRGFAACSMG